MEFGYPTGAVKTRRSWVISIAVHSGAALREFVLLLSTRKSNRLYTTDSGKQAMGQRVRGRAPIQGNIRPRTRLVIRRRPSQPNRQIFRRIPPSKVSGQTGKFPAMRSSLEQDYEVSKPPATQETGPQSVGPRWTRRMWNAPKLRRI